MSYDSAHVGGLLCLSSHRHRLPQRGRRARLYCSLTAPSVVLAYSWHCKFSLRFRQQPASHDFSRVEVAAVTLPIPRISVAGQPLIRSFVPFRWLAITHATGPQQSAIKPLNHPLTEKGGAEDRVFLHVQPTQLSSALFPSPLSHSRQRLDD